MLFTLPKVLNNTWVVYAVHTPAYGHPSEEGNLFCMDLSIVIVNYNSKGLTLSCIKSIRDANWQGLTYEIIVVDNGSNDYIGDIMAWQYPDIKFIQSPINIGMGAGNNLGFKSVAGKYFVVMNPDTLAMPDTFQILYKYLENNPDVGVVGPKQFNPDRSIQQSCFRWHSLFTPIYRRTFFGKYFFARQDLERFLMTDFDHNGIMDVDWLLGSCLFIRSEVYKKLHGFDDRFFLYFEDTDFSRRIHELNLRVVYNPNAQIIHNHNRQSARTPWYKFFTNYSTRAHVASWIKYLRKWG